nr:delta-1-pyrroline-5-carboxylate synthase-like [Tanacetum cinerariifolium]
MVQNSYGTPRESRRKSREAMSARRSERPKKSRCRPHLKSNPMKDRVMLNNSQGKKQEVEDHHRNAKFSKNKTYRDHQSKGAGDVVEQGKEREGRDPCLVSTLTKAIRVLANMEEPIGQVLKRTEMSSPLGVLVIFESRPEALVQV